MPNVWYKSFGIQRFGRKRWWGMGQTRVTIKDIAAAAGVSITTVSHALNNTRYGSPTTRAAVQAIADRLGYRPDPIARMLQGGNSLLIGHVLSALADNFFFGLVARGADLKGRAGGCQCLRELFPHA